jgi:hypothetical protein
VAVTAVPMYDAIGADAGSLPPGQAAGYATGTGPVPWTAADWAAHPGAVRIDQDPAARDPAADVLDVESGAASFADCPRWAEAAAAGYAAGTRPGQRSPAVYAALSNLTAVVNALLAGGITEGVSLWVADWNLVQPAARALVVNAGGPFPVIACQYGNRGSYDVSEVSTAWLAQVSGDPPAQPPPVPPGAWAYPAPGRLAAVPSRAVWLHWARAAVPPGQPPPASYTTAVYTAAGKLARQVTVTGLAVTVSGLGAGTYTAHTWADGAPGAPPHASVTFTV